MSWSNRYHIPLMGSIDGLTAGVTKYFPVVGRSTAGAAATGYYMIVGRKGIVHNLRAVVNQAPAGADTVTFALYLNGAVTALTCTITGTELSAVDTTNSVLIVAGDRICVRVVASATSGSLAGYTYMEIGNYS